MLVAWKQHKISGDGLVGRNTASLFCLSWAEFRDASTRSTGSERNVRKMLDGFVGIGI
jgi:hypothetical protein